MTALVLALALAAITGFFIQISLGPIASYCIQTTLKRGLGAGLAVGAGVSLVDAIYGGLGVIGAQLPQHLLRVERPLLHIGAAIVLVVFGIWLVRSRAPAIEAHELRPTRRSLSAAFATGVAITLPVPGAIPIFAAIFAAAGIRPIAAGDYPAIVGAVFAGAFAWWSFVALVVDRVAGPRLRGSIRSIGVIVGALMIAAGIVSLATAR
ncbi:MAG: LysE family transporter [Vulcanimicrobiaceae bacterium]